MNNMKNFSILFFVYLLSVFQSYSQVLNVKKVTQEQSQWCWTGITACILDYYCTPTSQCAIAEYTRTVETFPTISLGNLNCCESPATCNSTNFNWGGAGSIQDILVHFGKITNYGVASSISKAEITADILENKVFVIYWTWSTGGGHFVVGHGLVGNNVYYMDPWYGEGLKIGDYSWMQSGGLHTWRQTNRLSVSPNSSPPSSAGKIVGLDTICLGQDSVVYSVPLIANANSYIWSLPVGASGTSSTNSIKVNFGKSAISGKISVKGINTCGEGAADTLAITVKILPEKAGKIVGLDTVCQGQDSVVYSVPLIANASTYIWSLPVGASGTSSTNSIKINFSKSAVSGIISVKGVNSCGEGSADTIAITLKMLPEKAGKIVGLDTVCQAQDSVVYSVPLITNASSYIWSLPVGTSGTSSTNSIKVNFSKSALSGKITVKGVNSCGEGAADTLAITVNDIAATPTISLVGTVLHSDTPLGNQWYNQKGLLNGATDQDFTPTEDGEYYTIIWNSKCYSSKSNVLNVICTDNLGFENNIFITVYPIPISDELIIEIFGNKERINFEILNTYGQVISKGILVEKTTVLTNKFANGVYLIKFENGKTLEYKKVIK